MRPSELASIHCIPQRIPSSNHVDSVVCLSWLSHHLRLDYRLRHERWREGNIARQLGSTHMSCQACLQQAANHMRMAQQVAAEPCEPRSITSMPQSLRTGALSGCRALGRSKQSMMHLQRIDSEQLHMLHKVQKMTPLAP